MRVFFYRLSNFVRQFFNRPTGYTRYFIGAYGGYGATGGIAPVGGIQEPPIQHSIHSFWVGNVTSTEATVTVKIDNPQRTSYQLQRTTSNSSDVFSANIGQYNLIKYNLTNLLPNTEYTVRLFPDTGAFPLTNTYSFEAKFKTSPSTTTQSFKFGFASCSKSCPPECDAETPFNTGSNSQLYDNIRTKAENNELDFFVHLGDMHYRDISINDEKYFQEAYDSVFGTPRQRDCWSKIPMYYMWDDHDYGPNDTDKNNPARNAAIAAYRRRVPSPTLAKSGSTDAPYYSFVRGRVRFIVTDIRSEREPKGTYPSTNASQQVFSSDQKTWFQNEMLAAKAANQIIVWANTNPWVSSIQNNKDDWGGYHYARMEIVNFINTNELADRIVIISGDMHAMAYDDGTSPNNYGSLKVCHAAPLDEKVRFKGGPYTIGPIALDSGTGYATQYGIIEVTDNGGQFINIRFKGTAISKVDYTESTPIDVNFDLNTGYIPPETDPYAEYTTLLLNFD
jgi:alkaline phosphatase D